MQQRGAVSTGFDSGVQLSLRDQIAQFRQALTTSRVHYLILGLSIMLLFVILATTWVAVILNSWTVPFYNAIEHRDIPLFLKQLQSFVVIAASLTVLNVAQTWANERLAAALRKGIVGDLLQQWMARDNHAAIASAGGALTIHLDQRIYQDARALAETTSGLSIGFVQATIQLAGFVGPLWAISEGFVFNIGHVQQAIPGYMVWAAVIYAGLASILSRLVGRNLISLNAERENQEADFRFSLTEAVAESQSTATQGEQLRLLTKSLDKVVDAIRRIVIADTRLTWVSAGFGWLATVVPILVAAPIYFSGTLNFGGLMMAVGAFNQVQAALQWYVNNFEALATWRAHLLRVTALRALLVS